MLLAFLWTSRLNLRSEQSRVYTTADKVKPQTCEVFYISHEIFTLEGL